MTVAERIIEHLRAMPETEQNEVLDFVEYLESRARKRKASMEDEQWNLGSVASAMKGLEDDPTSYSVDDLKETF